MPGSGSDADEDEPVDLTGSGDEADEQAATQRKKAGIPELEHESLLSATAPKMLSLESK